MSQTDDILVFTFEATREIGENVAATLGLEERRYDGSPAIHRRGVHHDCFARRGRDQACPGL